MKSKLKIIFIHPDLGIGGAERLVLDIAGAVSKQYENVEFLTNHFDKSHTFEELKNDQFHVSVYGDWLPRSLFGKFVALCAYIRMIYLVLYHLIFEKTDECVYFVDLIPISIPFLKLWNKKVIYYCHHPDLLASEPGGTLKKLYRKPINWLELKATKRADYLLVNSEYTAYIFKKTFPEILIPINILYPTISLSYQETVKKLKSKPIHKIVDSIPPNDENFILLSINRFHPAKQLELAIEAMNNLKERQIKQFNHVFLIIAGGYDPQSSVNALYFIKLQQICQNFNLSRQIIFLKSPSDQLKAELLLSCNCLIYTPINEHFGIVPLEAMLVSKPVIACNSGGPRETIEHEVTGFLCEPNAKSLADFIIRMLENKSRTIKMGEMGLQRQQEKFSYEKFSECVLNAISQIK